MGRLWGKPSGDCQPRVTAVGVLEGQAARADYVATPVHFAPTAPRQVWLDGATAWCSAGSYVLTDRTRRGETLRRVEGPGLVDLPTSTLLVPPRVGVHGHEHR